MVSQGINQYLKFRAFGQHQFLNSGVVKPTIEGGQIKFINTLTGNDFTNFQNAAEEARGYGLTNIQVGDSARTGPTSTIRQLDKRAKELIGEDASVKLLEFKVTSDTQLSRITRDVLKSADVTRTMFHDGETVRFLTMTRGVGINTRFQPPGEVLKVAEDMGLYLEGYLKQSKRAKTFTSHKQMSFDPKFGSLKIGVFDPQDIYRRGSSGPAGDFFDRLGWGNIRSHFEESIKSKYGINPIKMQTEMIRALKAQGGVVEEIAEARFGRSFSSTDDLFQFLGASGRATDVQQLLIDSSAQLTAKRAFDGKGFIKRSLVEQLRRNVGDQLRDEFQLGFDVRGSDLNKYDLSAVSGTRGKELLRYYEDMTKALRQGGEFNLRGSGFQFSEILGFDAMQHLDDDADLSKMVMQFKGNYMIMEDEMFERYGDETLDIIAPLDNVQLGKASDHVAYMISQGMDPSKMPETGVLTAELNASKPYAYADVQSAALGDDVITRSQSDMFFEDARKALDELKVVADRTALGETVHMQADNRAFSIIRESLESSILSSNPEAAEHSIQMLDRLAEGTLPANELPVLIKRFGESLMQSRNGKSNPRIMLADTVRAYVSTSATEVTRTGGAAKVLKPGEFTIDEAGRIIFPDVDMFERYAAHGGPDLDDAFNIAMRADEDGNLIGLMYRQPNTSDEVSKIRIRNVHRSQALKNMLGRHSPEFANQLELLEKVSYQVYDQLGRADYTTRLEDIYGSVQNADDLALTSEEARRLRRAVGAGDIEGARQLLDVDVTTRMMEQNISQFDNLTEDIVSRAMATRFPEEDAAGITRFPGVSRRIGKGKAARDVEFTFDRLGEATKKLDSMGMLVQELQNPGLLGRWVNSKTSLGMFLQVNKDALQNIEDPKLVSRIANMMQNQIQEEQIIDALIQGGNITEEQINKINNLIARNWEEQARIVLDTEDLKMDDYFIENMPQSDLKRRIKMDADRNLAESITGENYRRAKEFQEEVFDLADETRRESFKSVNVSKDIADYAEAIEQELVDIKQMTGLSDDEKKAFQQLTIERRFFGSFEAGAFGQRSAELFAALSRGRFSGLLSSTVESAGLHVEEVAQFGFRNETLDTYARRTGRYVAPTDEFQAKLGAAGFDVNLFKKMGQRVSDAATPGTGDILVEQVEDAQYLFDRQGRLLPQSVVPVGDGTYEQLGSIVTDQARDEYRRQAARQMGPDLDEAAERLTRTARQALRDMPTAQAASTPRPAFEGARRGANLKRGGMLQEILGHLSPRTRAIGVAASAGIAASMIYNAVRDKEYGEDKIGPPQTVDDPYHQDLALSPANAARISQQFGTTYDIRTRGGNFGDGFLQTLAELTGGDVYANAYRDPYRDTTLQQTVGGSYR